MTLKIKEHTCGLQRNGLPRGGATDPADRKIYPVKCRDCDGKGKITDAN
jgi:hypothetical protein